RRTARLPSPPAPTARCGGGGSPPARSCPPSRGRTRRRCASPCRRAAGGSSAGGGGRGGASRRGPGRGGGGGGGGGARRAGGPATGGGGGGRLLRPLRRPHRQDAPGGAWPHAGGQRRRLRAGRPPCWHRQRRRHGAAVGRPDGPAAPQAVGPPGGGARRG